MSSIRWQVFLAVCTVLLFALALGYLARAQTLVAVPEYGGVYVEGVVGSPVYLNPILSYYNDVDQDLCQLIFDGLTQIGAQGEIVPNLAERWDVSEDGLSYTFELRKGIRWHDGAWLTAEDVLFTIQAMQDPAYRGPSNLRAFWEEITVEALDMYTVRFHLPQPFAPFPSYTTVGLLPAHLLKGVSAVELPFHPFNVSPIGTGSFKISELDMEHVVLKRNPDDYRPRPYLDRLEFRFYPDYQALIEAYSRGEIDGISRILPESLAYIWQDPSLRVYSAPLAGYSLVFLNLKSLLFQDKAVRQALLYATDRQALVDQVLNGQGIVAHSPIIPYSWAYDPTVKRYDYNPALARSLLEKAGWLTTGSGARGKDGMSLAFHLLTTDDPRRVRIAQELARQWAEVGVVVTPTTVSASELVRRFLEPRNFGAVLYEWQKLPPDPDPYALWHSTQATGEGQNFSGLRNEKIDVLLEQGRMQQGPNVRKRIYDEFQQQFAEEVPALLLYYPVYNYAISEKVQRVQLGPMVVPGDRFRTVRDWYILTKYVTASEAGFTSSP